MLKVYTDFEEVKRLSDKEGIKKTIKHLYLNIKILKKNLNSNDVQDIYDSYYSNFLDNHDAVREINGFKIHRYSQHIFEYLEMQENKNKRILDFGCGAGNIALALNSIGYHVHGIDFSDHVLKIAQSKTEQLKNKTSEIIFNNDDFFKLHKTYDYIIFGDVIEHISKSELEKVFIKATELLSESGEILINTPNARADAYGKNIFWATLTKFYRSFDSSESRKNPSEVDLRHAYYTQTHINVMYPCELKLLLRKTGFKKSHFIFFNDSTVFMGKLLNWFGISSDMTIIAQKNNSK
jgi:2-polyprenyl-3-methyl-5-hydroxy-6-metoxy-1,4-benzoquinol methylase